METTLGGRILAAAVLDKDYRSETERDSIVQECKKFCSLVAIHYCKEIENFVLVPSAIDRAAERKVIDQARRSGKTGKIAFAPFAEVFLDEFAQRKKSYVQAQYLAFRRAYERQQSSSIHEATFGEAIINEFEELWKAKPTRLTVVPGKEALSAINAYLQDKFDVNITPTSIVDAMTAGEIPKEMKLLLADLGAFSSMKPEETD
jgi:hypothetical protein